ncbi:MAG TPA: DUF433 domain-containing protein [Bryobacteraceae bacterium]|nr:DUF433 domain-containing protein [Bryobacteraceae bacterium]
MDWTTCPAVERHPHKVSGAWVFRGTRVPVSALFSSLEGGATVSEFLDWFPGVSLQPRIEREVRRHKPSIRPAPPRSNTAVDGSGVGP